MKRFGIGGTVAGLLAFGLAASLVAEAAQDPPADKPRVVSADRAIQELIEINASLAAENQRLTAENQRLLGESARLQLELTRVLKERDDLSAFIADHDAYGENYEKYTFFRERSEREERARQAAEAKLRREEERLRQQQEREERLRQREAGSENDAGLDDAIKKRLDTLRRAGYTRIGERAFVGNMGYAYRTETREEIRYSPLIDFWYVDRDEKVLYDEMTVSGSVIHAGLEVRNLSVAFAFFDDRGAQIGTTTVRIDAARPGTPYPFTATVTMAGNKPFKRYSAWVLYDEASAAPAAEAAPAPAPANPPADG